ncbi:MAG: hypothetical protein ABIU20_05015 [Blastocatellia bacterium]
MFVSNFKNISSKTLVGVSALLIALFATIATSQPASAQSRSKSPHGEMKNPKPDGKDCYMHEGKRYCLETKETKEAKEGSSNPSKLKAAPKPTRAPKDCYWYNGKLYCIYYGFTSGKQ